MTAVRHRPFELQLRHTFRLSRGASDTRRNLLLEVEDGGQIGLGEAAPIARYAQDAESAARAVDGMTPGLGDVRQFEGLAERLAVDGQSAAEAAVDIALRDLAAKRLGAPLWQVLGLDPSRCPATSFTIGIDAPEAAVEKVREASDFEILKIKLGGPDDVAMLEAIRDSTRQRLRVDVNEGWAGLDVDQPRRGQHGWKSSASRCSSSRSRPGKTMPRGLSVSAPACRFSPTKASTAPPTCRAWRAPATASISSS